MTGVFFVYVMLAALTIMNMLIGVLCEVVSAVAATEKEQLSCTWVKSRLQDLIDHLDQDKSGTISKKEFGQLLQYPEACKALKDVGVDAEMLVDNLDHFFEDDANLDTTQKDSDEEGAKPVDELMDMILDMRGSNTATVKDIIGIQKKHQEFTQAHARRTEKSTTNHIGRPANINCGANGTIRCASTHEIGARCVC
jgi:hypothetical protein